MTSAVHDHKAIKAALDRMQGKGASGQTFNSSGHAVAPDEPPTWGTHRPDPAQKACAACGMTADEATVTCAAIDCAYYAISNLDAAAIGREMARIAAAVREEEARLRYVSDVPWLVCPCEDCRRRMADSIVLIDSFAFINDLKAVDGGCSCDVCRERRAGTLPPIQTLKLSTAEMVEACYREAAVKARLTSGLGPELAEWLWRTVHSSERMAEGELDALIDLSDT